MIDLNRNRAELLAEIQAAEPQGEPLSDVTDPRVATADIHVCIRGNGKRDLFPLLKLALSERFARVPRSKLNGDLLIPLRNALGNAYKHGNGKDPAGIISVGIVLSPVGALITVTDQGAGFDVAGAVRRFHEREAYFVNRGIGFRNMDEARSTISYENGGRTLLLCFHPESRQDAFGKDHLRDEPAIQPGGSASDNGSFVGDRGQGGTRPGSDSSVTGAIRKSGIEESVPNVLDPSWIQDRLSTVLPEIRDGQARIERCRVYAIRGPADDGCGNRYVLRVARPGGHATETWILTGKLHATGEEAAADAEAAKTLHDAAITDRFLIPRPITGLRPEPRLVLYHFDPWLNLREYLVHRSGLKPLDHAAGRAGSALAGLHGSRLEFRNGGTPDENGRKLEMGKFHDLDGVEVRALVARAKANLATLPGGPGLVNRFQICLEQIEKLAPSRRRMPAAPIYGALDWDHIHFGVDGRFYLYPFESCRRSDPGLDLGAFAAELLCFTLAHHNEEAYRNCRDAFLSKYNSVAGQPVDKEDLRFHVALALVERLGRAECRTEAGAGRGLGALEAELGRNEPIVGSERL